MTAATPMFQGRIARSDLAALLDSAGEASRLSPRPLMGAAAILTPAASAPVKEAAHVLANPHTNLTLRLWSGERASAEMNVLFPDLPVGGRGVILNPVEADYQVAGFVDAERILAIVSPVLPREPQAPPPPFEFQADGVTMIVMAACLDLLNSQLVDGRARRLLAKQPLPHRLLDDARPLAGVEVSTYLKAMWGFSRFNQLLTAVFPLAMTVAAPSLGDTDAALDRLCRFGLLTRQRPDRFLPAAALEGVLRGLLGASAGLQWQRLSLLEDGALLLVERLYVLGGGGTAFELAPTPEGLLRLAVCTRRRIVDFLVHELGPYAGARLEAAPVANAAARFCGQCGAVRQPGWKFCGSCGGLLG